MQNVRTNKQTKKSQGKKLKHGEYSKLSSKK